jgi:monothiol glutaredoxin
MTSWMKARATRTQECGAEYEAVNVMDERQDGNRGVREAIKTLSDWPTTPQLYVRGEFLGGAEILLEMHQKGQLKAAVAS